MNLLVFLLGVMTILPTFSQKNNEICPKEIQIDLTRKQNEQLQYELLGMLGVSARPSSLPEKKMKSSSKFLLNVYKFLKDDDVNGNRVKKRSVLTLSAEILDKVHTSDVIVSLNSVQRKSKGQYKDITIIIKYRQRIFRSLKVQAGKLSLIKF